LDSDLEGPVNIGTGEGVTIAEVAQAAASAAGRPDLLQLGALPAREGEPDRLVADTGRLASIGFARKFSLEQGMAAMLAASR
jgi:nucleoside-diphosphate-sugar epimerase